MNRHLVFFAAVILAVIFLSLVLFKRKGLFIQNIGALHENGPTIENDGKVAAKPFCYINSKNCSSQLTQIVVNGRLVGYGIKVDTQTQLVSPFGGDSTTGKLYHISGKAYPVISISSDDKTNEVQKIEYILDTSQKLFLARRLLAGETVLNLQPSETYVEPYGNFNIIVRALNEEGKVIDPSVLIE